MPIQDSEESLSRILESVLSTANSGTDGFRALAEAAKLSPNADFVGVSLRNMDFRDEDLRGFNFADADLSGADFRRADVTGACFDRANLTGTIGLPDHILLSHRISPSDLIKPDFFSTNTPRVASLFFNVFLSLPRVQREAMFEIYSFCRHIDDIADATEEREERRHQLDRWRAAIDSLYTDTPSTELIELGRVIRQFSLKREDFCEVIDGMEMDVVTDIRAPDNATFELYCDRVGEAVGRLTMHVLNVEEELGASLAHNWGHALQITNILRDLDEDAARGRLYLPVEMLREAGIMDTDPSTVLANAALPQVCNELAIRARQFFTAADEIFATSRKRSVRSARIMAEIYKLILDKLVARGWEHPRRPVRVSKIRLTWIMLRNVW
jgi:presqualene diphosphate synthase